MLAPSADTVQGVRYMEELGPAAGIRGTLHDSRGVRCLVVEIPRDEFGGRAGDRQRERAAGYLRARVRRGAPAGAGPGGGGLQLRHWTPPVAAGAPRRHAPANI